MDGICRRKDDVVQLSMEHLIIEAYKRKDEAAELEKMEAAGTPQVEDPALAAEPEMAVAPLVKVLKRLAPVQEFIVLTQEKVIVAKNSGACSLTRIDPVEIDRLLQPLSSDLNFGPYRYAIFNSAKRYRYLLFRCQENCILVKLRPGAQSLQVVRELEQYISG